MSKTRSRRTRPPGSRLSWPLSMGQFNLGAQLLALYLLVVGPVVIVALLFDLYASRRLVADVETADLALARAVALETNSFIESASQAVRQPDTNEEITAVEADSIAEIVGKFLSVRPDEGLSLAIIDAAGHVIASSDPSLIFANAMTVFPLASDEVLNGHSGNLITEDPSGTEMLFSYAPIPGEGWGVILSQPTALAFATPRTIHNIILLAVAVFLLFGLLFWIALSRRVIRPLEQLTSFSQAIGTDENIPIESRVALDRIAERPDQMGDLTQSLQRIELSIDAWFKEISTLLATSGAVVSTLEPPKVLERILEQVEHLLGIHMCAIIALDEASGEFRAQASRGLSSHYVEHINIDPREPQSITLRAIQSGQPIQISDTEQDSTFTAMRPRARTEGYRSVLAVPLNTQHAPPSSLLVYRPEPHTFTPREVELLSSFANHAAMAIENAALYEQSSTRLQEQTRRLEALVQSLMTGLVLEDLHGKVLYANRSIAELAGMPVEALQGLPVRTLLDKLLDHSKVGANLRAAVDAVQEGQGERHIEIALDLPGGTRYLRLQVFDVMDPEGTRIGRGQIFQDITQMRELDRMKSSLVATVSHELRTPLAAIKGYATTLLAEDVQWDMASQREFLSIISSEADRLSEMVNNLLDMSRIEAGNLSVARIACDLGELIHNAALRANPHPSDRLIISIPSDLPPILADPQRIEVVLRNLIENAVKYAGEHSRIRVSASRAKNLVVTRIEDQGPGIPAEHKDRIFDSFYRVEGGLKRQIAGAGLGLAISQGFVRAHGGDIWLEPRSRGTCVAFSLPIDIVLQEEPMDQVLQGEKPASG